ncbi:MAG TPA: hypothetical protein VGH33_14010, partial [Isosphaeraceae bacterium]
MGILATVLSLAVLGFGGYRLARSVFGLSSGFPAVVGAFVLAWTWVTLGTLGLGLLGWLERGLLLVWSLGGPLAASLLLKPGSQAGSEVDPTSR